MKRAIITGATGAIGTALIDELIRHKAEILLFLRKDSSRNDVIPNHPLITKKFCSLSELAEAENDSGKQYDVFYHFAWEGTSGSSRQDMRLQNRNVTYALDAVELAKKYGCHTFIGAGSQAEYGRFDGNLQPDTPTFPENGYGIAKLCAGLMTRIRAKQLDMRHVWVRVLSVYGPRDGQSMIMSTIQKLQSGSAAEFTKGEQLWDYLYSADAAEAFRLIGEKGVDGKTYVLGSGQARPLAEYIRILARTLNSEQLVRLGAIPYAEKQVMHLCADISELTKDTGWQPRVCFEDGIRLTAESVQS